MTDRLRPLQHSHAVNELEAELKDLFIKLYSDALAATTDDVNVYGAPRLGSFSLVERNVDQDGLTVLRETTESRIRYVFDAWRNRNPERGLHFLRLYLMALFGDSVTAGQLWQRKDVDYPLALATSEEIDANGGNYDDYFLTSRVRVDIDTDIVQSKLLASLKSAVAARILLNVRIGKLLQASLYLAAAGHTVSVMRLGSYGVRESEVADVVYLGSSFVNRGIVSRVWNPSGYAVSENLTLPASGVMTVYSDYRVSFTADGDTEGEIVHAPDGGALVLRSGTPHWWVSVIADSDVLAALGSEAGTPVPVVLGAGMADHGFDNRHPANYAQLLTGQRFKLGAMLEPTSDLTHYALNRVRQLFSVDSFGRPQANTPGIAVISVGAADYVGFGDYMTIAESVMESLAEIKNRVLSAGAKVVFCSQVQLFDTGGTLDYLQMINEHMRQLAAADPSRVRFADYYDLVQDNVAMLDDGAFTPLGAATAGKVIAAEMLRFVRNRVGVGAFHLGHEYDNLVINGQLAGSSGTKVNISGNVANGVAAEYDGSGVCAGSKRMEGGSYAWQVFDVVGAAAGDELTVELDLEDVEAGDVLFSEVGFEVAGAGVKHISHALEFTGGGKRDTNHSLLDVSSSASLAGAIKGVLRTRNLGAPIWTEAAILKIRAELLAGDTEIKIRNVGAAKIASEVPEPLPPVSYDPDAQALFDRMTVPPDAEFKERVNNFVVGLKNPALWGVDGALWGRLDSLYVPASAQNEQSGSLDWRRNASATFSGGASWDAELGFVGAAGGLPSVDTGWSPLANPADNFKSQSAQLTIFLTRTNTRANGIVAGVENGVRTQIIATEGSTIGARINTNDVASTISTELAAAGMLITIQRDSTVTPFGSLMVDGLHSAASTQTPTTATYAGRNLRLLSSIASGSPTNSSSGAVGMSCVGAPITLTEQATLKALYTAYVSAE